MEDGFYKHCNQKMRHRLPFIERRYECYKPSAGHEQGRYVLG